MNEHDIAEQAYKNGYKNGYSAGTRDAVKVEHGFWIDGCTVRNGERKYSIDCSECDSVFYIESHDGEYWKEKFEWCPFCGAKMDLPELPEEE